jgi:anti-sigma factor RsiW
MAGVADGELAAFADGELPTDRRAEVRAAIAASPELARRLGVQLRAASAIRAAAERVQAPTRLRAALAAQGNGGQRNGGGNPSGPRRT